MIFIHNPKTGGETIDALLELKRSDKHKFPKEMKNKLKNQYSFVFVRHPISRIISWYNHLLKHKYFKSIESNELNDKSECYNLLKNNIKLGPTKHRLLAEKHNINDWIKIMIENENIYAQSKSGPLSFQYNYVFDDDGTKLVTDVFKFENYEENLKHVLTKLDKKHLINKIKKTNMSIKKNDIINEESKKLIYEYFKKDFDSFDYDI